MEGPNATSQSLYHLSLNPTSPQTILLIHGAFTTSADWDLVTPFLSQYHILIPDLPGHGASHTIPFSLPTTTTLLHDLIQSSAHNSTALVVGHSLGAKIAISLASTHPTVVSKVFVSGYEVFPLPRFSSMVPYAAWTTKRLENWIPRSLVKYLMDGTDIRVSDTSWCTVELCRGICGVMADEEWPAPWGQPTLVVAAGKAGLLPTSDHPEDARRLARIGREGNPETKAVVHAEMRHPWNRQAPELFADAVRAWFEEGRVLDGFVDL